MERLADIKVRLEPGIEITAENKCGYCTNSYCCTYVTEELITPRSKQDYEHLLWQVSHEGVEVYRDDEGWWLMVSARCSHLQGDGRCGIYEARPQICRDHSNDYCEFDTPVEEDYELHFPDYETLLRYCKKRFKRWDRG
ncbi:MAG: YkgJ family cysteine cluster protein [Proteobacteria bacterium]|nr:YkgJ family cysteine cluster protein [Pseudomonadota bacterium]